MPSFVTHTVLNQVPPLEDYSLFETDPALREAAVREGAGAWLGDLGAHGAWLGRAQTLAAGVDANRYPPRLQAYDRTGHRIDHVDFHPAWQLLMSGIVARGLHSRAWAQPVPGAQVARAAAYLMQGQVEAGTLCPTTMTFAAVPLLQREPAGVIDYTGDWLPALYSREFDGADAPLAGKRGALIGMGLTEKQGGSDLRAVTTRAAPMGAIGRGCAYLLVGHKWFFSVPQADAHLVLAQTDEGLGCFLVPRWIPEGPRNAVRIRRLKDKLGNHSNASAEVEFEDAWGVMVGEPGRGLAVLLEMAATTRLDCVLGSAAFAAPGPGAVAAPCLPPPGFRQAVGGAAADAQCAGRPRAGVGGRPGAGAAPGARGGRAWRRRRARAGAGRHARRQAVGLQARDRGGGRMHGGMGRQRLRRRGTDAAAVSRNAGQFHLGRVRQCHGAGCAACLAARARGAARAGRRVRPGPRPVPRVRCRAGAVARPVGGPGAGGVPGQAHRLRPGVPVAGGAADPARAGAGGAGVRRQPPGGCGRSVRRAGGGLDVGTILARAWPAAAAC